MNIEKIKPIPEYIKKSILKIDNTYTGFCGHTRFYSYLTKNEGELVKVTVAVKKYKGKMYFKQVAVHGIHSKECFVKDMVFHYIGGYSVGWFNEGLQKSIRWYESDDWGTADDKYFDPFAVLVNKEYALNFPEYKYSAIQFYNGNEILKYLRTYEKYPQMEYLMKAGLYYYAFSKQILIKVGKDKSFCKWLMKNRTELQLDYFYVDVVLDAYRSKKPLKTLQKLKQMKLSLGHESRLETLRKAFKNDINLFLEYIVKQNTNFYSYNDYFTACNYLGLDMSIEKNRYPHDFKRWHDIRVDEYNTAKAMKDEQERKELYDKFASVASKYLALQRNMKDTFIVVIAQKPSDLVHEGEVLHHCVGLMGYDQKFVREESLIFFVRLKDSPEQPLVTIEYSLSNHKVLQCYGDHDSKPNDEILNFVNKKWLPYANRKLKQIAA